MPLLRAERHFVVQLAADHVAETYGSDKEKLRPASLLWSPLSVCSQDVVAEKS